MSLRRSTDPQQSESGLSLLGGQGNDVHHAQVLVEVRLRATSSTREAALPGTW